MMTPWSRSVVTLIVTLFMSLILTLPSSKSSAGQVKSLDFVTFRRAELPHVNGVVDVDGIVDTLRQGLRDNQIQQIEPRLDKAFKLVRVNKKTIIIDTNWIPLNPHMDNLQERYWQVVVSFLEKDQVWTLETKVFLGSRRPSMGRPDRTSILGNSNSDHDPDVRFLFRVRSNLHNFCEAKMKGLTSIK